MIKAVVFDFDGLIIDTETPSYHAFRQVYENYGLNLDVETFSRCIGTTFDAFNPYTYLEEQLGRKLDLTAMERDVMKIFNKLVEKQSLRPGVIDYLTTAHNNGLQIGLATSSPHSWIAPLLDRFGLWKYFNSITTADDVARVKPDPELYVKSLDKLGVSGKEAIAFEDSLNGLRAAKAAGMHCVVVPNPVTAHFPFQQHDLLIRSMEEKSLPEVIALVEKRNDND